ncbi:Pleckstrin y domain-containing family A member 3 [Portunus trituberculatus]|uniref:Pleckstrin y domain-containing family A member 3 n=1 Tax=Portunus trituberculatus TaxID=210409 RepID=A0A5B7FIA7_PORTR|nr:Pleckstrin y domain-containing family A member 3 [Portunus trituberculatus]
MEGILYKWTNYWNGWQPRWFVLDKGVLAYYKSQEEVNQGSKGSVKLSACEILVHPTDTLRIDIVIPYEQRFYLKAPSSHERHAWLVALGSAKAGIPPAIPQPKKLDESTTLLSATCDTFIQTLEECMKLSNTSPTPQLSGETLIAPITLLKERKTSSSSTPIVTRQNSTERYDI